MARHDAAIAAYRRKHKAMATDNLRPWLCIWVELLCSSLHKREGEKERRKERETKKRTGIHTLCKDLHLQNLYVLILLNKYGEIVNSPKRKAEHFDKKSASKMRAKALAAI